MVKKVYDDVYSVSQVNKLIKALVEGERRFANIQVRGEISNFKRYSSGHCYFTLKDAGGVLKAVMFKTAARTLRFEPQNGDTVIAVGRISVYERDGVYQLYTDLMIPEGTGDLMLAFEQLKQKLLNEGLFDESRKKQLPVNPKTVGIITSPSGAAVRDLITVSRRRNKGIKLLLYPVRVQGKEAPAEIAHAIEFMNRNKMADVLIVGRGGGSIEELWAFNEEQTVRAVAASEIPVVSAVGHETDFTLTDFAADKRAATPSQAAEIVVADANAYLNSVAELEKRLKNTVLKRLALSGTTLERLQNSWALSNPQRMLEGRMQRFDFASVRLEQVFNAALTQKQHSCGVLAAKLDALSPLTVLARGYSVTENTDGKIIRSIADVRWGDEIVTQVGDGNVISVVQHTEGR